MTLRPSDRRAPPGIRMRPAATHRVDPSKPLAFDYRGRPLVGLEGDTVASALYANGVRIFSRSLKYHRPRGLYTMDAESSNTFMNIDGVPNEAAETTRLEAGMSVRPQNVWGSPERDLLGGIDRFDRMMPAGFYYRHFHRPYRLWPFFRDRLRAMAGIGVLDPNRKYNEGIRAERYLNADLAVVGGGASGMEAARVAAARGLQVCLFETRPWLGGHRAWRVRDFRGLPLYRGATVQSARLKATKGVRVFTRSPVTGVWGENLLTGFTVGAAGDAFRACHWECRARAVVVATGAMERPLVFNHNDRPGVVQAGTAWRLARSYAVRVGQAAVFSVGDDLSLEAALDLFDLGLEVRAVADARAEGHDPELVGALRERGIPFLPGWAASLAIGRKWVTGCEVRALAGADSRRFECDVVVANAGLQPRIGPLATAGAALSYCPRTHSYQPVRLPPGLFAAGSMTGRREPGSVEASGRLAGLRAARWCGLAREAEVATATREVAAEPGPARGCGVVYGPAIGQGRKAFIDLDEDGTYKNACESAAQGFGAPELAKRFGGFGLGPGQYQVAGQNLAMIMADLAGSPFEAVAPTTIRPPLVPPSLATVAGACHDVHKRTPLHRKQVTMGAIFRRVGGWERARYFGSGLAGTGAPPFGSREDETRDEIRNVRRNVGLLDSSSLGKFRIFGPDALQALQRVYISDMRKVGPKRCKYTAMCNDTGNVMDDGVVVKEGENDYYFTTSSSRAGDTAEWFRYHTRYEAWDYHLVNLTDVSGSVNLAGPNARKVLEKVTADDVSNQAFPYLGYRRIVVGEGVKVRCFRLGFVGELSFELHAPSSHCPYIWDLLMEVGAEFDIRPFGLEAQYCMRAEKGHIIVGAETEQRVTLTDIGMGFLWDADDTTSKKVGAPALRAALEQPGRMKRVGFRVRDPAGRPQDGGLVVRDGEIVGYVCTTRYSETLGWQYGMALVQDGHADLGEEIRIYEKTGRGREVTHWAVVVPMEFYDPKGERTRGSGDRPPLGEAGLPERPRVQVLERQPHLGALAQRSGAGSVPGNGPSRALPKTQVPLPFRCSPVAFPAAPAEQEIRGGWNVVRRYLGEEGHSGPWLVDLSHLRRWDYQDGKVETRIPLGLPVPREVGQVGVHGSVVIARMNPTQASVWHMAPGPPPGTPSEACWTETTDGHCMVAFVGQGVSIVLEHLSALDLFDPQRPRPFLTQGPVLRVPCQVVTFAQDLVVMTLSRGYGKTFVAAALESGGPAGLAPAGEGVFMASIANWEALGS